MMIFYKYQKTVGPQAANLLSGMHELGRTIFTLQDVEKFTGLKPKSARNFAATLVGRGLATRLKPGLFILVPFELSRGCVIIPWRSMAEAWET